MIGILNSVVTDKAWNNDINCCSVSHIQNYFNSYVDLSDLNELRSWTENLEKTYIEQEIAAFEESKRDFFEKLNSNNKVIYSDIEKANSNTTRQIKRYLSMLQNIRLLENEAPNLYIKFKGIVTKYVNLVEEDYTSYEFTSLLTDDELNSEAFINTDISEESLEDYLLDNTNIEDLLIE